MENIQRTTTKEKRNGEGIKSISPQKKERGVLPGCQNRSVCRDLYEALKYIIRELDKAGVIKSDSVFMVSPQKALSKAEGKC